MKINQIVTESEVVVERKTMDKSSITDVLNDPYINVGFELEFDATSISSPPERDDDEERDEDDENYYDDEEPIDETPGLYEVARMLHRIGIDPETHDSPGNYKPEDDESPDGEDEDNEPYPLYLNEIGLDEFDYHFSPLESEFYGDNSVDVYERLRKLFHALYNKADQGLDAEFDGDEEQVQDIFSFLADRFDIVTLATMLQIYPQAGWFGPKLNYSPEENPDRVQESFVMKLMSLDITDDDAVKNFVRSLGKVTGIYDPRYVAPEEDPLEATVEEVYTGWVLTTDSSVASDGEGGYELVSPVLPLKKCLDSIERLFKWIDEEAFATTNKTGFHVSMSYGSKKTTKKADLLKLAILLDEETIIKQFNRVGNRYTVPQLNHIKGMISEELKSNIRSDGLDAVISKMRKDFLLDKYAAINIKKFDAKGYLEFRIMGGAGYHSDFNKVRKVILKYALCLKAALDPDAFRKEYLTKLYKMLDMQTQESGERTKVISSDLLAKGLHTVSENPETVVDLYAKFKDEAEDYKRNNDAGAIKKAANTLIDMMVYGLGYRKPNGR